MSSVLFVGAGRHQRRAIAQARERGLRVVAVDRNPDAPGLALADAPEVVDFVDVDAVEEVARRHEVNGALTVSADRAVPVVAAVTERLGLPTIGTDVAHRMTHKIAMRRTLAEEGIPQPAFAAVRSLAEGRAALETVGLPAVLKPVDSGGQRGLFRIETPGDLESHLHSALAESPGREAILEGFVEGHGDERHRRRARGRRRGSSRSPTGSGRPASASASAGSTSTPRRSTPTSSRSPSGSPSARSPPSASATGSPSPS